MAAFMTRFKNQEVWIKETSSEHPILATVKKIYVEAGYPFYLLVSDGEEFSVQVSGVEWIRPKRMAKIIQIGNKRPALKIVRSK